MVNYADGKIYRIAPICDHDEGDVYIGSTTNRLLCQRMGSHRCHYRSWLQGGYNYVYVFKLFERYGVDQCRIELLECVNAANWDELAAREAFYIRSMGCVNKCIPYRTRKEYYIENKEKKLEYQKKYDDQNREIINEKQRLRRQLKLQRRTTSGALAEDTPDVHALCEADQRS